MDTSFLRIGAKITLISMANVRYEGILVKINAEFLQIILSDVRICGTEDRPAIVYIPVQEVIYPFVLFENEDISKIYVVDKLPTSAELLKVFARREYPQSTFSIPHDDVSSSDQRTFNTSAINNSVFRVPNYSGNTKEPSTHDNEESSFENDDDFKRCKAAYDDLIERMKNTNLNCESEIENENKLENGNEALGNSTENQNESHENSQQIEVETVSKTTQTQGAIPKKYEKSKAITTTAVNNNFVSCSDAAASASIYRSPHSSPNRPMRRHRRRKRRPAVNECAKILSADD